MDCKSCQGKCCKQMFIGIANDVNPDFIRWAEYHKGIEIVKWEGHNLLKIDIACSKLNDKGECTIYDTRPELCQAFDCDKITLQF